MATKMGVREFRDNFTSIARDATEPVIVTNHDKVIGWFTPANREPRSIPDMIGSLEAIRRRVEGRGINVTRRMQELGLEDDSLFEDPWNEAKARRKRASKSRTKRSK